MLFFTEKSKLFFGSFIILTYICSENELKDISFKINIQFLLLVMTMVFSIDKTINMCIFAI